MGSVWKDKVKQNLSKNESNLLLLNHHLIKNARILTLDKLTSKEIYSVSISSPKNRHTSQNYFENSFPNYSFDWKQIYLLPQIITINSYQCNSQYKILHNILHLNKKLYIFGKIYSPLCSIAIQVMRLMHICLLNVYVSANYGVNLGYFSQLI